MDINSLLLIGVGLILVLTAIKLIFTRDLIETVVMMSVFSLLIGVCYLLMDAPDVAMTEVALSGCLSTCILLKVLKSIKTEDMKVELVHKGLAFIVCSIFVVVLTFTSLDLPSYGDIDTPVNTHTYKYYIENTKHDIGIPSFVAAILASYRGYDTLGETMVILIAGLGVVLVLNKTKNGKTSQD